MTSIIGKYVVIFKCLVSFLDYKVVIPNSFFFVSGTVELILSITKESNGIHVKVYNRE